MIVIESKLAEILGRSLGEGNHESLEKGLCVMEAVSYVAGEPWSDQPKCACPVISAFMRAWNDCLPNDAERDRLLKPLIPQLVDSKSTPRVEERRSYLALDWLIRVHTPKWLDLVPALASRAKGLRDLEEIADLAGATAAGETVRAARDAAWVAAGAAARDAAGATAGATAWAAARATARDAARDAAWDAARDAAWAAAWVAAGAAAWDAARDAAWAAAWDAAWAAARAAARATARAALKPTTDWLQASALDLVERMLAAQTKVGMGVAP